MLTLPTDSPTGVTTAAPRPEPRSSWRRIESDVQAAELAWELQSPDQPLPSLVVTTPHHRSHPHIEMTELANEIAGRASLYLLRTGSASVAFASGMPRRTEVYGGAIRMYPLGTRWMDDPYQAPLIFVNPQDTCSDVLPRILELLEPSPALRLAYSTTGGPWGPSRNTGPSAERQAHDELSDLRRQVQHWRQAASAARNNPRRKRAASPLPSHFAQANPNAFLEPERQFRWEVECAWVQRIPASDKDRLPLQQYRIGPDFLASLESVGGMDRGKVVEVVVEIVTGLVEHSPGRQLHRLRQPSGSSSTRGDGATCWRAAIQVGSPSARRIHFWRLHGHIELSRVGLHDDMRS